ncbi:MAG: hypothetical protein ACWA5W_06570 [Phycisphaerales bacterium]
MPSPLSAYLTVISWPQAFSEPDRIRALVECAQMDPYQAKLASRRNLPGIVTRLDPSTCRLAAASMQNRGVLCLNLTREDINNYPNPEFALGIEQFPDANPARFVVKSPTDAHWTFGADEVKLAICGYIKATSTSINADTSPLNIGTGPEFAVARAMTSDHAFVSRNTRMIQLLDLHIEIAGPPSTSGAPSGLRLVRLIGPHTRIGIVGDTGRPSLLDNSKPIEMVQILMPNAHIDTEFQDFDPPSDIRKLALKRGGKASELTLDSWGFYSPWIGLIRQTVFGW